MNNYSPNQVKKILLMYSNYTPSSHHINNLSEIQPCAEIIVAENEAIAIKEAPDTDVILGHRYLRQCLPYTKHLHWVQASSHGFDHLPYLELARKNVLLTRITSSANAIARHAMTLAWSITRCLPEAWTRQKAGIWDIAFDWLPFPSRAIVFGTGHIGCALAKMLKNDGIEVTGVKRNLNQQLVPEFDHLCDQHSWLDQLPKMDWCFLALPHSHETRNMFNKTAMLALPNHAVLVNVGRGQTLVTADLIEVLSQGHLGGVALDVIDPKPMDRNNPIWETPRLFITPYVASRYLERWAEVENFVEKQLTRFVTDKPLLNIVEFSRG